MGPQCLCHDHHLCQCLMRQKCGFLGIKGMYCQQKLILKRNKQKKISRLFEFEYAKFKLSIKLQTTPLCNTLLT